MPEGVGDVVSLGHRSKLYRAAVELWPEVIDVIVSGGFDQIPEIG
jgi:hypothetical protein